MKPMKVLVVDDDVDSLAIASLRLKKDGYTIETAGSGDECMDKAREKRPDLILLDVQMPGRSGYEVCEELKSDQELSNIPVIFLSAADDTSDKVKGLDLGAVDYVTKPFDVFELRARVRAALRTKRLQDLLLKYSEVDSLTEIYNRRVLMSRLHQEWDRTLRSGGVISFIMVDIDRFKRVNDTYGHPVGDEVLETIAYILKNSIRSGDIVGRYGGEEFGIVMVNSTSDEAALAADRYRRVIQMAVFQSKKGEFSVTASFGTADSRRRENVAELVAAADAALYKAKETGRNKVCRSD
ncbi:diguanylate cyclase response regulator [Candidatus Fermentibacteria bacterium]|nr:MAG: diguanylate cyclase response regulator [Candidatus Fermentibacteria bacterium]